VQSSGQFASGPAELLKEKLSERGIGRPDIYGLD
jgi:hypothetical protein